MSEAHHELIQHDPGEHEGGTDRGFSLVFGGFFLLVALWPLWKGAPVRWWSLGGSAAFFLVAGTVPSLMHYPNVWWLRFAAALSAVTNPIITGLLFYVIFTPVAAVLRLTGSDLLRLRRDPELKTYWQPKHPPGPPPATMTRQY